MSKVKLHIGGLKKICDDADTPAAILSAKNLALAYATDAEKQGDEARAENTLLRTLLKRYRDEVASGFHPHMICEEVDKVLSPLLTSGEN